MPEALRRALILDDILLGVQSGALSRREAEVVRWLLNNNSFRLDNNALMLTELRNRVIAACPLLQEESDSEASEAVTAGNATGAAEDQLHRNGSTKDGTDNSFGLSPEATH